VKVCLEERLVGSVENFPEERNRLGEGAELFFVILVHDACLVLKPAALLFQVCAE
jgi:hypothetical protein